MRKPADHVRYSSPYGTPSARMRRDEAEAHLDEDDRRWVRDSRAGLLNPRQIAHGPPRIEELPR